MTKDYRQTQSRSKCTGTYDIEDLQSENANLRKQVAKLEHENTMLIGEAEELKAKVKRLDTGLQEANKLTLKYMLKLKTAIKVLEDYAELYPTPDEIVVEALNKLRSE